MGTEQACGEGQESVTQKEVLGREGRHCHCSSARKGGSMFTETRGDPSAFHTAQSLLISLLQDISACSFSLGVFIVKSKAEDKKTWLLKW